MYNNYQAINLQRRIVYQSINGVERIKCHIHRVRISAGSLKREACENITFSPAFKNKTWGKKYYTSIMFIHGKNTEKATVHLGRHNPNIPMPLYFIETSHSSPSFLLDLLSMFGSAKMSSVEYALDFYCKSPEAANALFYLLRRYCYFPRWSGKILTYGGEYVGWGDVPAENQVYKVFNKSKKRRNAVKVYERGPDAKKRIKCSKPYWKRKDIDRVRLEFTEKNKGNSCLLSRLGIREFQGFIKSPRFIRVFRNKFEFAVFTGKSLPNEFDDYNSPDKYGCCESFQAEYKAAKLKGINTSRSKVKSQLIPKSFLKRIQKAIRSGEKRWQRDLRKACYQ